MQLRVGRKLIVDVDRANFTHLVNEEMKKSTSADIVKGKGKGAANFFWVKCAKKAISRIFLSYVKRSEWEQILGINEGDSEETEGWKKMLGGDVVELRETTKVEMERSLTGVKEAFMNIREGQYEKNTILTIFGGPGCEDLFRKLERLSYGKKLRGDSEDISFKARKPLSEWNEY